MQKPIPTTPKCELKYNLESFKHKSTRDLYKKQLIAIKLQNKIEEGDDVGYHGAK